MRKNFLIVCVQLFALSLCAQTKVSNLLCENLTNPVGIDVAEPGLSWQLSSDKRNTMQTAYEIRVVEGNQIAWSSGKVLSDSSVHVRYKGESLQSGKKYYWQVRVWDNNGKGSGWSSTAIWQMGLLKPSDWTAKWIEAASVDTMDRITPLFRKAFQLDKKIRSATAFITAHGLYEASINGKKIGDAYLTPGWTSYNKRLQYQTYDVTALLQNGANAVGVMLGSGWYRGTLAWGGNKDVYGKNLGLLFQLEIIYDDGTKETIGSEDSWRSSTGNILYSEIYNGEINDARKEKINWATASYDDKDWHAVIVKDHDKNILVATQNEPVKKHETFKPVNIFITPKGEQVIDFGQNLVGFVELKVKGEPGKTITISHAEVLDKKREFLYRKFTRGKRAGCIYFKRKW